MYGNRWNCERVQKRSGTLDFRRHGATTTEETIEFVEINETNRDRITWRKFTNDRGNFIRNKKIHYLIYNKTAS